MPRPPIRKSSSSTAVESPEALFHSLQRKRSHSYLRGPQQDVLREYFARYKASSDFAVELPTGAGKTAVGLLLAEWHRRKSGARTAFLTLTNQLAGQVLEEARALSISVADLRGRKEERDQQDEMKFRDASAIAISTYSNLFNVNPVVAQCSTLILDDAHGGGSFASSMWSVRVTEEQLPELFAELKGALAPLLTPSQAGDFEEGSGPSSVALVDCGASPGTIDQITAVLEGLPAKHNARYAWSKVRGHLSACHILLARDAVTIRPYIPPTWDHSHFADADTRCFLSATLGDVDDLKRAYGVQHLELVRAQTSQDGRRYIFVPGMALDDHQIKVALAEIWKHLDPRRVVAVAPSFLSIGSLVAKLSPIVGNARFLQAKDIEDSLAPFTSQSNVVLAVANRYDGLDLPDDDCRLLLLNESPKAVNDLETCLSQEWRLGLALRGREATRLVQGMGRCTRSATDYAVILLLGESLINSVTTPDLVRRFPRSLKAEIAWGKAQLAEVSQNPKAFAEMVLGLIDDATYRADANDSIDDVEEEGLVARQTEAVSIGSREVGFSRALWNGDYSHAHDVAREITDKLSGTEWAGLRAWWLYLASVSARLAEEPSAELDALRRAKSTGINAGWFDYQLRIRSKGATKAANDDRGSAAEARQAIWGVIENLGWAGKRYHEFCKEMVSDLAAVNNHKLFHRGLTSLGRLLGARSWSPEGQGVPDVVWGFGDEIWFCFEAKCEKLSEGSGFLKRDLLEGKGHVDWLKAHIPISSNAQIKSIMVGPSKKTHSVAEPHRTTLFFISNESILGKARKAADDIQRLRVKFTGRDYPEAIEDFRIEVEQVKVDLESTVAFLQTTPM